MLCEARDRFGGRILTVSDRGLAVPAELGAEFIHGRPAELLEILREAGIADVDTADERWQGCGGELTRAREDDFAATAELIAGARSLNDADLSVDEYLRRVAPDGSRARTAAENVRYLVAGFDAADPARASARAIAEEWSGDASISSASSRPVGGYARAVEHLCGSLDPGRVQTFTHTIVERVAWGRGEVRVHARRLAEPLEIAAAAAIVTVPIGVLQRRDGGPGAIRFEPDLPAYKRAAIGGIVMGPAKKAVLQFRTAFWEELAAGRYRDAAFFNGRGLAFPAIWTQFPVRARTLTAWAGGTDGHRLADLGDEETLLAALDSIADLFGEDAGVRAGFVAGYTHDWQRDQFACGAYSYLAVGAAGAREDYAKPIGGALFFAGEAAAAGGEAGTVGGALASGARAARELTRSPAPSHR